MVKLARIHRLNKRIEPVWHVQAALLVAIALQFLLDNELTIGHKYIIAGIELLLMILLAAVRPNKRPTIEKTRHTLAISLITIITLANLTSLFLVIHELFNGSAVSGKDLILCALAIYLTNIIIFGLWYWELDSDGAQGQSTDVLPIDFLFPQMTVPNSKAAKDWAPTFFDYLYISVTNGTAFGTNDTAPLTHRAKLLMTFQSTISIIVIALVVTRAVSILA